MTKQDMIDILINNSMGYVSQKPEKIKAAFYTTSFSVCCSIPAEDDFKDNYVIIRDQFLAMGIPSYFALPFAINYDNITGVLLCTR